MKRMIIPLLVLVAAAIILGPLLRHPKTPGQPHFRPLKLNPQERYVITLWDHDYPFQTGEFSSYAGFLQEALAVFNSEHPNIEVKVELLPIDAGVRMLQEALDDGRPPDVYGSWWQIGVPQHRLLVPATPYWSRDDDAQYLPTARELVRQSGEIVLWPRWISPHFILANPAAKQLALPAEFTWEDLLQWGKTGLKLAVNNSRGDFLAELVLGQDAALDPHQRLLNAALFIEQLKTAGLLEEESGSAYRELFEDFFSEEPFLVGGLNPALAAFILASAPDSRILPPLRPKNAQPKVIATVDGYAVFRQENYRGDETTQAAVHLARHLSRYRSGLFPWICVPAYLPETQRWVKNSDRNIHLLTLCTQGEVVLFRPLSEALGLDTGDEHVRQIIREFWDGTITGDLLFRRLKENETAPS